MFYSPLHTQLQDKILCYWFIRSLNIPHNTKMFPDGYSDMMINAGDPYLLTDHEGHTQTISESRFFAQRTKYLLLTQSGSVTMLGLRLKPGAEFLLTGIHAAHCIGTSVPLSTLFGSAIHKVEDMLRNPDLNEGQVIEEVEKILVKAIYDSDRKWDETMKTAVDIATKSKGNLSAESLMNSLEITYKRGERLFKKHLGLSPKTYLRVLRFHNAFTQIRSLSHADWMQVLVNCGYYDQSHFIKDFRFFTGTSPAKQLNEKDALDQVIGFK